MPGDSDGEVLIGKVSSTHKPADRPRPLLRREFNGVLGAVVGGELGLFLQIARHLALHQQDGVAVVVYAEQFGRGDVAAAVALARFAVVVDPHVRLLSGSEVTGSSIRRLGVGGGTRTPTP